ncbi:hypothetical protein GCM10007049_03760 [Echinicola pacifica]|uniref:O-antigen ligase like membrane protein n=1 Tax=Echinicola pacifica TaxID=346377 RepID=A0A918UJH7_9BACT|nr:hypothetical protein [Echinicola pacifica]GGZ14978.1 hypothetical protein GCM10007049_03760 [Echinicola pacifica]
MIIILIALILIGYFIYDQKNFIYALMVFYLLFDMFDGFYKDLKVFAAIRYVLPLIMVIAYIIANKAIKAKDGIFFLLSAYLIALVIFNHGHLILSAKTTFAVIITLSMVIVGRYFGTQRQFITEFEPFNRFMLIAIPIYIAYANIFRVGDSYSSSFTTGFLDTSRMYIAPIVIFMGVHYVLNSKKNSLFLKTVDITFITLNIINLMVITRRTSVGMLAFAIILYAVINGKVIFKLATVFVILVGIMILAYPLYEGQLQAQLAERERIQDVGSYEDTEPRYQEVLFMIQHFENENDPKQVFFGVQLFDTTDFGIRYFGYGRPIHSDINMIIYSTGLIGLTLFLLFFITYFIADNSKIASENKMIYYPLLIMLLIVLIPGRFIGTFTFGPLLILLLSGTKYSRSKKRTQTIVQKRKGIPMHQRIVQTPTT